MVNESKSGFAVYVALIVTWCEEVEDLQRFHSGTASHLQGKSGTLIIHRHDLNIKYLVICKSAALIDDRPICCKIREGGFN